MAGGRKIINPLERPTLADRLAVLKSHPELAAKRGLTTSGIIQKLIDEKKDKTKLDLTDEGVTDDILIDDVIPFLQQHPEIKTVLLRDTQLTDKSDAALDSLTTVENLVVDEKVKAAKAKPGLFIPAQESNPAEQTAAPVARPGAGK